MKPSARRTARHLLSTVLVASSLLLSGCGGGGGDTSAATDPAADTMTPTALKTLPPPAPLPAPTPATTAITSVLNLNPGAPANYAAPVLPAYYDAALQASDNTPPNNRISDKVATLGRVLFHDKRLSVNNAVACASCHQAAAGFSDSNRFSAGFSGTAFTTAHSMRLGNLRYFRPGTTFWDQRAASVELQATQPIQHPVEMGFDAAHGGLAALLQKMQALPYYPALFTLAFGDGAITEPRIQQALAQFQRSMISSNSRWDSAYARVYNPALTDKGLSLPLAGFTPTEERGRVLFMLAPPQGGLNCAACHVPPTFALAGNSFSNGLDAGETRRFKSPALKSVALSGAFMHDGRFATLEAVVEHYNSGVQAGPALDRRLIGPNGQPRRLNLSAADKGALVAFLRTLNDPVLAADARFSNPFKP